MRTVLLEGSYMDIGYDLGKQLAGEIEHNIHCAIREAKIMGAENLLGKNKFAGLFSSSSLEMMKGISKGSRISFEHIIKYNLLHEMIFSEDCTVFAAVGKACIGGNAVFLKNRDRRRATTKDVESGSDYFHNNLEINVVQVIKISEENVIIGITSAGSVGFTAGLNRYGVATGSNGGPSKQKYKTLLRKQGKEHFGADGLMTGRMELMREGLEYRTAKDAVKHVLGRMVKDSAMPTPGNLWFVDSKDIYVIEGAVEDFAVHHVTDGIAVRANHFLLLENANKHSEPWIEVSTFCRYFRGKQLMEEHFGNIDRKKMINISMDHQNGPTNSICNHCKATNPLQTANTVAAAIMELNSEIPEKSRISMALGSPCWAWRSSKANVTFQMDDDVKNIPEDFLNGLNFKEYVKEEPFEG